jgi:hypothetical protein
MSHENSQITHLDSVCTPSCPLISLRSCLIFFLICSLGLSICLLFGQLYVPVHFIYLPYKYYEVIQRTSKIVHEFISRVLHIHEGLRNF